MKFKNKEHQRFYLEMMAAAKSNDTYHRSFFYTLGINEDTRNHVNDLYDSKEDIIKLKGLNKGWQTSGSISITALAFNLWNGWANDDKKYDVDVSPSSLFCNANAKYMHEALDIRYPEYARSQDKNPIHKDTHEQRY